MYESSDLRLPAEFYQIEPPLTTQPVRHPTGSIRPSQGRFDLRRQRDHGADTLRTQPSIPRRRFWL